MSRLLGWMRVLEAVLLLVVAHLLRRLPMTRWAGLIGARTAVGDPLSSSPAPAVSAVVVPDVERRVSSAVRRALVRLSRLPVTFTCLDQAVAGSVMLQRRGERPSVVVGLDRADPANGSHAWLVGGSGRVLVGGEGRAGFVSVTAFRPGREDRPAEVRG